MNQKTALVTGGLGAVGRYVTSALAARGWQVVGLGHGSWNPDDPHSYGLSHWVEGDVSLANLMALKANPHLIVACAGGSSVGASVNAPYVDFQRTVNSTVAILEFMRLHCPDAALVYPSSAAAYGVVERLPISEDAPLCPSSPYGVHKKIAEEIIAEYSRFFELKTIIVRLFSVYGEGFRKQLLWDACHRIAANETVFFGTGDETRDWIHGSDAAELLVQAADYASSACPIVNGAYGEQVTVRDILTKLFALMHRNDLPQFSGEVRSGDPLHYHADISKALAWGWQPHIDWQEGLRRYVSWFEEECRNH
ncbi:NAD-dependent epimerase/dehydratase family protein [Nodosilinea sp. LEGE 07088]|uniref:NAD-dependent epimerase/dehydratase family protein n=1 Tax=Nodosilinea sp. LEGE 07088 TaxID=2777968 RepID=UPI0018814011|nr:NAD-dependent epimerase/dehydratase family protein [Nodosilinea sp. LEGE 07088]MBE9139847.1 NAD-dependent epimerase/dehydratase family protein [Nodosilinea sp. LEGE 07088]